MPPDFPEMFVQLGWRDVEDHFATAQSTIKRWLGEVGEADLIRRRRSYLRKQ